MTTVKCFQCNKVRSMQPDSIMKICCGKTMEEIEYNPSYRPEKQIVRVRK